MSINERVQSIIDKQYNGNKSAFSKAINVGATVIQNIVGTRQGKPSYDVIESICANANISAEWLLTGQGSMLKNNSCATIAECKDTKKVLNKQLKVANNSTKGIPLIPLHAMAGALQGETSVLEYECEQYVVPAFKGADFLIPVKGNSMSPTYQSGDIVACQRTPMSSVFFQWNKPYVLDTAQGAIIKRIRPGQDDEHIKIVSDNTDYLPFELHKSEIYAVALVIGIIRLE